MDDRGFSLVELITVIAIMAVLGSVLVAQYMKYYNNSCVVTDVTNAEELAKVVSAAVAGQEGVTVPARIQGKGGTAVTGVEGLTTLPYSKKDKDAEWVITVSQGDGTIQISLGGYVIYPGGEEGSPYYDAFYAK